MRWSGTAGARRPRPARHTFQVQIINRRKPELLRRALAGEPVGTVIYVGKQNDPAKGLWKRKPVKKARAAGRDRNGR